MLRQATADVNNKLKLSYLSGILVVGAAQFVQDRHADAEARSWRRIHGIAGR